METNTNDADGTFEACLSYLRTKGHVLWGDYSLNPNEDGSGHYKNEAAARWLETQVRGVADHYDTPTRTYHPAQPYAGPYSAERSGGGLRPDPKPRPTDTTGGRPSALITHGQQPEAW